MVRIMDIQDVPGVHILPNHPLCTAELSVCTVAGVPFHFNRYFGCIYLLHGYDYSVNPCEV